MKKMLFLIPAAVFGLFACGEKSAKTADSSQSETAAVQPVVSAQIAYVNLDSLLNHYDLYIDRNAEMQAKASKAEAELTSKTRSLEKSFADAQEKIDKGLITRTEAMQLQQDLQNQEQALLTHRDKIQRELAEDGQVLMNNIINNIDTFLDEFNADYHYSMILTTSGGAPVMHADPRLNITDVVLKGLNEKYSKDKKSQPKK